jgi:hypothetical protein
MSDRPKTNLFFQQSAPSLKAVTLSGAPAVIDVIDKNRSLKL